MEEMDEAEEALLQRQRLEAVVRFLKDHNAEDKMIDAIAIAIADLDQWIDEDLATVARDGKLMGGTA